MSRQSGRQADEYQWHVTRNAVIILHCISIYIKPCLWPEIDVKNEQCFARDALIISEWLESFKKGF